MRSQLFEIHNQYHGAAAQKYHGKTIANNCRRSQTVIGSFALKILNWQHRQKNQIKPQQGKSKNSHRLLDPLFIG